MSFHSIADIGSRVGDLRKTWNGQFITSKLEVEWDFIIMCVFVCVCVCVHICTMFLKEVSYAAHQGCIHLMKKGIIMKYYSFK